MIIAFGLCKKDVISLRMHWSYAFFAQTRWSVVWIVHGKDDTKQQYFFLEGGGGVMQFYI